MTHGLHQFITNTRQLLAAIEQIPENERLAAVKEKDWNGDTVLHVAARNPEALKAVLALLPENERLAAVKEKNRNGDTVLHWAARNPEALKAVLALYPENERLAAVKEKDRYGDTVLHWAAQNPEALKAVLGHLPENERLAAVKEKDTKGIAVLHWAARNPEALKAVLALLPENERLAAVKEKNRNGDTVLHWADRNPEALKAVLALYPKNERLAAVKEKDRNGDTVLHVATQNPEALKAVLGHLPENERLAAVKEKDWNGSTVLHLAAKKPEVLKAVLSCFKSMLDDEGKLIINDEQIRDFLSNENLLGLSYNQVEVPIGLLAFNTFYTLNKMFEALSRDDADLALTDSYAGSLDKVKKSEERYEAARTHYSGVFNKDFKNKIENVEKALKKDILEGVKKSAKGASKDAIVSLLTDENIEKLALGENAELAQRARELFTSNDNIYQVAWRAYDKDAARTGWDNLFVAPVQDKNVHSGEAEDIPLSAASKAVRERVVMYYLAAIDESTDEISQGREDRVNALISNIAECRRAHNIAEAGDAANIEVDNPSCYPGTITRISNSLISHPLFKEPEDIEEQIRLRVKTLAENKLTAILAGDKSRDDKEKIYLSTLMLGLGNISEILIEPSTQSILTPAGDEHKKTELTSKRAEFLRAMDIGEVIQDVTRYLTAKSIIVNPPKLEFLVVKSMLDIGGLNLGLTTEQRAALGYAATESQAEPLQDNPFPPPLPLETIQGTQAWQAERGEKEKQKIELANYYVPLYKNKLYEAFKAIDNNFNDDDIRNIVDVVFSNMESVDSIEKLKAKLGRTGEAVIKELDDLGLSSGTITAGNIGTAISNTKIKLPRRPRPECVSDEQVPPSKRRRQGS